MKILLLDNYDSFTYNLVHLVKELGYTDIDVVRNDQLLLGDVEKYDKIILSPGPGIPSESGLLIPIIKSYASSKPILGVCLGHQAIGESFGAKLLNLEDVYHGISDIATIIDYDYILDGIDSTIEVGRYHSWIVDRKEIPECFRITSVDKNGQIMSMVHREYDVHGVQFHPESVLTPEGRKIVQNFLSNKGSNI